mmetsp:Transcript_17190/g.36974  ORF Transcript_17190/g.36974 Transcript_17190/m.36974 type:complete len:284 (+) Transcript_17190:1000-1851(+)
MQQLLFLSKTRYPLPELQVGFPLLGARLVRENEVKVLWGLIVTQKVLQRRLVDEAKWPGPAPHGTVLVDDVVDVLVASFRGRRGPRSGERERGGGVAALHHQRQGRADHSQVLRQHPHHTCELQDSLWLALLMVCVQRKLVVLWTARHCVKVHRSLPEEPRVCLVEALYSKLLPVKLVEKVHVVVEAGFEAPFRVAVVRFKVSLESFLATEIYEQIGLARGSCVACDQVFASKLAQMNLEPVQRRCFSYNGSLRRQHLVGNAVPRICGNKRGARHLGRTIFQP